jgi:APA family basic amino acid/polyamine antiporter
VLLLVRLGPAALAASPDPIAAAVPAWLAPVVRVGAALAALGSLLALVLGVSRTTLAMSRDGHLPRFLTAVHPRYGVPHRAELAVGLVVAVLAASIDLRAAIGFSSFAVLAYYAIANAAALTLRSSRFVAALGLAGAWCWPSACPGRRCWPAVAFCCWALRPTAFAGSAGEKSPNRPKHPKKVGCPGVAHLV